MSMSILSALQCLGAFMAYLVMTVFVPSVAFGKRFKKYDVTKRFMLYFSIGNFFMMNLVFILQLLHISCKFTLLLGTIVPVILLYARNNNISIVGKIKELFATFNSLITGKLGIKTVLFRFGAWVLNGIAAVGRKFKEIFIYNIVDWVLIGIFTFVFIKLFAANLVTNYGYAYSDLPVHNYWINELGKNNIFVAGIYPFGFHCIIYYLHEIFAFDIYVLLRVFCVVQTFFVNIMILTVLKSCCKTKFAPYFGLFGYTILNVFAENTFQRFTGTLPQEFGMLFIFPCAYFAFEFFKERKKELELEKYLYGSAKERRAKRKQERIDRKNARKNGEKIKKQYFKLRVMESHSTLYLAGFAMNFAMTLAVHFYGTMIAGLLAVGIAVGFAFRFIRPKYFVRIVATCAISVFVAVLPMAIAFAMGTPLQGSLGWGMKILTGEKDDDSSNGEYVAYVTTDEAVIADLIASGDSVKLSGEGVMVSAGSVAASGEGVMVSAGSVAASGESALVSSESTVASGPTIFYVKEMATKLYFNRVGFVKMKKIHNNGVLNIIDKGNHYFYNMDELKYRRPLAFYINLLISNPGRFFDKMSYIVQTDSKKIVEQTMDKVFVNATKNQVEIGYVIALIFLVVGVVYIIIRHPDYGAAIVSVVIFMILMSLLITAERIGLPTLMDSIRASIYFAYMTTIVFALIVDACVYTLFGWLKWKWVKWVKHVVSLLLLVLFVLAADKYNYIKEPVIADYLETNEAIACLTNIIKDEEDFKWTICSANDETQMGEGHGYHYEIIEFLRKMEGRGGSAMLTIPTDTVYFFIEKVPLDYNVSYEDSGQKISEKGAANKLPNGTGISVYKAKSRWIVMSRMYYWAQEFQRLYPNEMKVYMETDNFICYKIKQNPNRLYNFAIDYGYNTRNYDNQQESKQ